MYLTLLNCTFKNDWDANFYAFTTIFFNLLGCFVILILKFCITQKEKHLPCIFGDTVYLLLMKEISFSFLIRRIPPVKCGNGKSPFFNPKRTIDSGQDQQWMLKFFGERLLGTWQADKALSPPLDYFLITK